MKKLTKNEIDNLFYGAEKKHVGREVFYDVKITANKDGHIEPGKRIVFAFANEGVKAINGRAYGEVSRPQKGGEPMDVLYFRFHNEKKTANIHKFSFCCDKNNIKPSSRRYFTARPVDAKDEELFLNDWVNKIYKLEYDPDNGMYFVKKKRVWPC